MARWDDLRRAIRAKDMDGAERLWLELIEPAPSDIRPHVEAAELCAQTTGGRRQAGVLLWLLADALKTAGHHRQLLPVYGSLARHTPDEGDLRGQAEEALRAAYPSRADVDQLVATSGLTDSAKSADTAIEALIRLLRIEMDAYVFHKSGWGVGRIVGHDPAHGTCTIDFREREGHEMQVEMAAKLLERLEDDDIRVQAMIDPKGLRTRAKAEPLEVLRQALSRYEHGARLKNLKEALVPDAVAPSTWSKWWREAKKHALLDPRFVVGEGRDPKVAFHDVAESDFSTQVEVALKRSATTLDRQKAIRDLMTVVGSQPEARAILVERTQKELERTNRAADKVGWLLLMASMTDLDPVSEIAEALGQASDPMSVVRGIADDTTRRTAGAGLLRSNEAGPKHVFDLALEDDPEMAEVGSKGWEGAGHPDMLKELFVEIDKRPAQLPNLYAWYLRGQRRDRWNLEIADPTKHVLRVLKVVDAVEYRMRRKASAKDKKAVASLTEVLLAKDGKLVLAAAKVCDEDHARHLAVMISQNRAFTPRALEKLQEVVLRLHPTALRDRKLAGVVVEEADEDEGTGHEIYMTAAGLARLKADHKKLTDEEMPTNRAEIARAREFGDLKENAEYHAAREKQGMLEAKAKQLDADIARAKILTADIVQIDTVSVGSRVRLKDDDGSDVTYTLLGPPDADPSKGVLSYQTPLARALMGKKPGDQVRLDIEGEIRELEVLGIENGLSS